jgi:hypothetical protein
MIISNCTLSSNSAYFAAWAYNDGSYGSATLRVNNSTLTSDSPVFAGIYNFGDSGSATLAIGNTILNTGASGPTIRNLSGIVTSLGYNLSDDDGGGLLNQTETTFPASRPF